MCSCSDTDIDPFIVIGVVIMLKKKHDVTTGLFAVNGPGWVTQGSFMCEPHHHPSLSQYLNNQVSTI